MCKTNARHGESGRTHLNEAPLPQKTLPQRRLNKYILRIPEQARGLYYQGESMRALQLLSQVRFKSPKNPYWLAVLSIETMCRHDVGDSAGESLALSRLDELGRKASAGSPLAKELDKLRARY